MKNPLIKYEKVSIRYGKRIILQDIDFEANKGDFIFITGKIGSGKTTFLKSLYGEIKISSGSATVSGFNLKKLNIWNIHKLRRKIGYIFQDFKFLNDRNIAENLKFVLKAVGWEDENKIKARIEEVLTDLELIDKENKYPYELSGGERQNLSIARALLNYPEIILADEPTANLDIETAKKVMDKIYALKQNSAVIVVSHDVNLLSSYAGEMYILTNQKLINT